MPFEVKLTDITGSGTSREVTAHLTNSSKGDVHNVKAKVEGFCQDSRLKVCGKDCIEEDLGDIKAGETVSKRSKVQLGFLDCLKIAKNGARLVVTITSDESTQSFNFDHNP